MNKEKQAVILEKQQQIARLASEVIELLAEVQDVEDVNKGDGVAM